MKNLAPTLSLLAALSACSYNNDEQADMRSGVDMPQQCNAQAGDPFIGRAAAPDMREELGKELIDATRARELRWIRPNQPTSTDFRPDRLNISVDEDNLITRIDCG